MAQTTWWNLVSGHPTPKTWVKQALHSAEVARQVVNSYQEAIVKYVIQVFYSRELAKIEAEVRSENAIKAKEKAQVMVKTKARQLFEDFIRPYVIDKLTEEERSYTKESFREMLLEWVHLAQNNSLKPRNQKVDKAAQGW